MSVASKSNLAADPRRPKLLRELMGERARRSIDEVAEAVLDHELLPAGFHGGLEPAVTWFGRPLAYGPVAHKSPESMSRTRT